MNKETREQIALARYKLISPVLAEPGRVQNEYLDVRENARNFRPASAPTTVSYSRGKVVR